MSNECGPLEALQGVVLEDQEGDGQEDEGEGPPIFQPLTGWDLFVMQRYGGS